MHFFSRRNASLALSLAAVGVLAACGDDVTVPVAPPAPVTVSITPQAVSLNPGASATLSVQIAGGDPTPTLASCSTGAASVATAAVSGSSCTVTAVAPGATTITATTSAGQSASAAVTVNALPSAINGDLAVSPATAAISVGQQVTLVPSLNLGGSGVTATYTYAVEPAGVVSLSGTGSNRSVTAVAPGVATVTVSVTASGTGFTSATRQAAVTINVTAAPPALTGLTVSPATLSMPSGGASQLVASVTQPAGATAATLTFESSNEGVATVSGTGANATVTAVAPGTATITVTATAPATATLSAATLTQLVPVTVNPRAQVAIGDIRRQIDNLPVDITNVQGQIQVALNITTFGQNVSSAQVWVCNQGEDVPTCAARTNGVPAAQQSFGEAGANDGTINTFINTAEFTVAADWSSATVRHTNGQKVIVSTLTVPGQAAIASNNLAILNFNNTDNFAARHIAPANSALSDNGGGTDALTWYGGPGASGQGSATVVPVIYTAGRTIVSANAAITGAACSNTPVAFTGAGPWTITYGAGTNSGAFRGCTGTSAILAGDAGDLGIQVISAIDNASNNMTIPGVYATSSSNVPAVTLPAIIRADYQAPAFTVSNPATNWASGALDNYNWRTNTSAPTDAGVGPNATSTFSYAYTGCGATSVAMPNASAQDIPECGTNFTSDVYQVAATGADRLGNSIARSTPASPNRFAIDNIAPLLRYTVGGATPTPGQGPGSFADTTTFTVTATSIFTGTSFVAIPAATDTIFGTDALDERSGFEATAAQHFLARANQLNNTGTCLVAAASSTPGANFITAPTCGYTNGVAPANLTLGAAMVDGYRPIEARILGATIAAAEGYYSYSVRIADRAGNTTTLPVRRVLHSANAPVMTGMGIPSTVTAAGDNVFTPNFTELVESYLNQFSVVYGADTLDYPAVATNTRFDNAIGANGNTSVGTPFSAGVRFYTNIQSTLANNTLAPAVPAVGDTASVRPGFVVSAAANVGGQTSNDFGVALLGPNVENDAAAWRVDAANKGNLVDSVFVAPWAAAWNASADGLKVRAFASSVAINSPFTRVDVYSRALGSSDAWRYTGSVDATATPCLGPTAGCSVYIADNGAQRVWTYVLRQSANSPNSLLTYVLGAATTGVITTPPTATEIMAILTSGSNGRVLRTQTANFP